MNWPSVQSYTASCINGNIRLENGFLILPKAEKVAIHLHRLLPENGTVKSATVRRQNGHYSVSLLLEFENQEVQKKEIEKAVGVDMSMKELYIDSEGNSANYPRFYRQNQKKLAKEQRKLSRMNKGSANWQRQKEKVTRIQRHTACQRKDFLHKKSFSLAEEYDLVCIEDLDMQDMSKALNFGKSVMDNGWGFTSFLEYKLKDRGKQLVRVDKWFPSSQSCSVCGTKNPEVKDLKVRKWICPRCGTFHDRDVSAAINIKNEGLRLVCR